MEHQNSSRDVTIKINDVLIPCIKEDLKQRSSYFGAMFSGNFVEDNLNVVELKDVADKLITSMKYLLTKDQTIKRSLLRVQPFCLLEAAVIYQFERDIIEVQQVIIQNMNAHAITAINFAGVFNLVQLRKKALLVCLVEFEILKYSEQFASVSDEITFYEIIDHNNLEVQTELNVFHSLRFWICHHGDKDTNLFKFLQAVRFANLNKADAMKIADDPLVKKNKQCLEMLNVIISLYDGPPLLCQTCLTSSLGEACHCQVSVETRDLVLAVWRKRRTCSFLPCVIARDAADNSYAYRVDVNSSTCERLFPFPPHNIAHNGRQNLIGFRVTMIGYRIYLFGGEWGIGRGLFNMTVHCFNSVSETWSEAGQILIPRRHFIICQTEDYIFLVGGTGKRRITIGGSIEIFNIRTGQSAVFMDHPGPITAAYAKNNYLYIITGYMVRKINIATKTISLIRNLQSVGGGFLYVNWDYIFFYQSGNLRRVREDKQNEAPAIITALDMIHIDNFTIILKENLFSFYLGSGSQLLCRQIDIKNRGELIRTIINVDFTIIVGVTKIPYFN